MEHIQKGFNKKEDMAIMELELGEMGSESKHTDQINIVNKD